MTLFQGLSSIAAHISIILHKLPSVIRHRDLDVRFISLNLKPVSVCKRTTFISRTRWRGQSVGNWAAQAEGSRFKSWRGRNSGGVHVARGMRQDASRASPRYPGDSERDKAVKKKRKKTLKEREAFLSQCHTPNSDCNTMQQQQAVSRQRKKDRPVPKSGDISNNRKRDNHAALFLSYVRYFGYKLSWMPLFQGHMPGWGCEAWARYSSSLRESPFPIPLPCVSVVHAELQY